MFGAPEWVVCTAASRETNVYSLFHSISVHPLILLPTLDTVKIGTYSPSGLRKRRSGSVSLAGSSPHISHFGAIAEQDENDNVPTSPPAVPSYSPKVGAQLLSLST